MKWKLTALLALLAIAILTGILLCQSTPLTSLNVPPQRLAGGVLLVGLLIWMFLYERYRAKQPKQRFLSDVARKEKTIVKKSWQGKLRRKPTNDSI